MPDEPDDFAEILRIQRMITDNTRRELQEDRITELMALINSLIPPDKKIQIEYLFYTAMSKGFSEKEIRDVLKKFVRDKIIFQPEVGYVQRR